MDLAVLVLVLVPATMLVLAVTALASSRRVPLHAWHLSGESKGATTAGIILSGGLGGLYYWLVVRRRLQHGLAQASEAAPAAAANRRRA